MYKQRVAALLVCLCLPITLVLADTELEMSEIVVTATRTEEEILTAPGHVTVLDAEEISRSGAKNLADLLTRQAGIKINDYGAEGAVKSISIRGSASAQVLILVNGVRLNDSRQGGANLSQISLENIEKIEIIRGGFSALYGADAVAGVINIITKTDADNRLKLKVENGSYIPHAAVEVSEGPTETVVDANWLDLADTQKLSLQYSTELGVLDLVASGSFTRAANGFVWNDTEYIDDYRRRINADLLGGDGYLSLTAPLGNGSLGINASFNYQDIGVPGSINDGDFFLSTDARQRSLTAMGQVYFDTDRFLTDLLSLDAKAFYKLSKMAFDNPPSDPSIHTLHSFGLDFTQELIALEMLSVVYGGNLLFDLVDSTQVDTRNRISGGVFLELPIYPLPQLTIIPVVRYDLYSDFPGSFNFKLSTVYSVADSLAFKLSGGSSYRAPTFNDLYWPNDGGSEGNKDLTPESGYHGELGVTVATERLHLDGFAFARYLIDAIQWTETSPDFYEPMNIGRLFYPGVELNAELNLFHNVWLTGDYTFLYSFTLEGSSATYSFSDDKRAPYAPLHSFDTVLEYRGDKLQASISAEYVDKVYTDDANSTQIDAYYVVNTLLRYRMNDLLTLQVAVDNVLNSSYEILTDYIAPPVSFWLGAELTL
jgi:vitamin B12 transporter